MNTQASVSPYNRLEIYSLTGEEEEEEGKKRERREEDMLEEVEQAIDGETAEEVDAVETQEGRV